MIHAVMHGCAVIFIKMCTDFSVYAYRREKLNLKPANQTKSTLNTILLQESKCFTCLVKKHHASGNPTHHHWVKKSFPG